MNTSALYTTVYATMHLQLKLDQCITMLICIDWYDVDAEPQTDRAFWLRPLFFIFHCR